VRYDVERQRVGKHLILTLPSNQIMLHPRPQFLHPFLPRAGGSLVSGTEDLFDPVLLVQGPQGHDGDGGGAVGVGDETGGTDGRRVDFGDDEGDVIVVAVRVRVCVCVFIELIDYYIIILLFILYIFIYSLHGIFSPFPHIYVPERRRVINHVRAPLLTDLLGILQGKRARHRQKHKITLPGRLHGEQLNFLVAVGGFDRLARAPFRCEETERVKRDGEAAVFQDLHEGGREGGGEDRDGRQS